jgi:hypothetical protein
MAVVGVVVGVGVGGVGVLGVVVGTSDGCRNKQSSPPNTDLLYWR